MTPADFLGGNTLVWLENTGLYTDYVDNPYAVRPVINVTTNNGFTSGSGTVSDPYTLS